VISLKPLFQKFKQEPVDLDASTGIAIAKLMVLCGIDARHEAAMITYLCFTLLQNWQIRISGPAQTRNAVRAFVETFMSATSDVGLTYKAEQCAREAMTAWNRRKTKSW
jgi:Flp pilus assembly CpaE family ATPase